MRFHDGSPVTAADAVASLRRWAARRVDGSAMMAAAASLEAKDELTFELVLREPFAAVLETLANPILPTFVLRARDAAADPFTQQDFQQVIGSGPFTFNRSEWQVGHRVVYRRFADYRPRPEPPSGFAGGKVVHFDIVEWNILPDQSTAIQAILRDEVDVLDGPQIDLLPLVQNNPSVRIQLLDEMGWLGIVRPNALHPPFNDPRARQALAMLVDQRAYLTAIVGNLPLQRPCLAVLICGSPYESTVASEPFAQRNVARARELLRESGYTNQPVVLMGPTDIPILNSIAVVTAQNMRDAGINVDFQQMDWGTLSNRQQRKEAPGQGSPGWNIYVTAAPGLLFFNPLTNFGMATPCDGRNWNGWTCDEELEHRRLAIAQAATPEARRAAVEAIQRRFYEVMPYIGIGQYQWPKVLRSNIVDVPAGFELVFWGMRRS
jgi:peptide/nickel transport system substrate-binding protein